MPVLTAAAPFAKIVRMQATNYYVEDGNFGHRIGHVDVIRGFAHYTGVKGQAHEGFSCIIRGGIDALQAALAEGIRNGRDDRADHGQEYPTPERGRGTYGRGGRYYGRQR